jgi:hypothetical protein
MSAMLKREPGMSAWHSPAATAVEPLVVVSACDMDEPGSPATTLMATMIPAFALMLQTVN